jgi:hypothetical protein
MIKVTLSCDFKPMIISYGEFFFRKKFCVDLTLDHYPFAGTCTFQNRLYDTNIS